MSTILNFGAPRSGTTFMVKMFKNYNEVKSFPGISRDFPKIYENNIVIKKHIVDFIQKFNNITTYHMKIGEASILHPMNNQVHFIKFCNLLPKPIMLLRTYRHPLNIYKSLLEQNGNINMFPRFSTWTKESVMAMLLSEYAGYLTIKNEYDILSLNFDDSESMIDSIRNCSFFDENLKNHCINFIENTYEKIYVRPGIRSKKVTMDISRSDKLDFDKFSNILNNLKESFK